jgi:hypothetical protein
MTVGSVEQTTGADRDTDLLGERYPCFVIRSGERQRWDMSCLLAASEMTPYIDHVPGHLIGHNVKAFYDSEFEFETGKPGEIDVLLAEVRRAGLWNYLMRMYE